MTIVEFLLARIAEDEETARAGISGQADPENGWGYDAESRALTPHVVQYSLEDLHAWMQAHRVES